jgi:hypothetical protein
MADVHYGDAAGEIDVLAPLGIVDPGTMRPFHVALRPAGMALGDEPVPFFYNGLLHCTELRITLPGSRRAGRRPSPRRFRPLESAGILFRMTPASSLNLLTGVEQVAYQPTGGSAQAAPVLCLRAPPGSTPAEWAKPFNAILHNREVCD